MNAFGEFRIIWMCGVEDMVSDTDGEGGRDHMTGVFNLSQEFGFYPKGNGEP